MPRSFDSVFYGAAGTSTGDPVDDEFNRVSFLSHFDGANNGVNNAFDDGSADNLTITAVGNATQGSFGPFARPDGEFGVSFDGSTTGYISVPTDTDFDLTNATTLEFWVFIPEDQTDVLVLGRHGLYWFGADYAGGGGSANKFSFLVMPDGSSTFSAIHSSANIVHNQWYFVQLIYSGTTVTFYLDGASQGTLTSFTPEAGLSKPFYVGGYGGQLNANSILSNIRFSNVARSTSVPTAPFAIDSNTKLLLCSSNRFTDRSSQAAVVSSYAGASVTAFGPFLTSAVYDPAVNGASAFLDGSGDYLTTPYASSIANWYSTDYTIEAWVYYTAFTQSPAPGGHPNVLKHGQIGSANDYWSFGAIANGTLKFYYFNGAAIDTCVSTATLSLNTWHHIAMCHDDSDNEINLYLDGVSVKTHTVAGTPQSSSSSIIIMGEAQSSYFTGYMNDLRVINGTEVYTSNFTPPTAPLTAITNTKLLLNMADGQAIDSAAQNNLTLFGTAKTSTGQAKFGDTSLLLDGNSDYVSFADADAGSMFNFGATKWTIEGWFYQENDASTGSNSHAIISRWDNQNSDKGFIFRITDSSGQKLQWLHTADGSTNVVYTDSRTISNDTWYHFALVKNDNLTLYLNGTGAVLNSSTFTIVSTTIPTLIGSLHESASPSQYFDGYIDDLRVSHMARYTSDFTAPSAAFADKGQDA